MRIDKFIGNNSDLSRSQIHALIKAGDVLCNERPVSSPDLKISSTDIVQVNGQILSEQGPIYLMLHKPAGVISATSDATQPTVIDLIHLPQKNKLQIVGRLDKDTTGLLLITDDGQWNHRITSPKQSHTKTYEVITADPIDHSVIEIFAAGILLEHESKKTLPAQLFILDSCRARLVINEGKYHQVKRMFAAVGNRVVQLHRSAIGRLALDPQLKPGAYRTLTPDEMQLVSQAFESESLSGENHA